MSGHCPRGASQNGSKSYSFYGGPFDHLTVVSSNDRNDSESDCIMTGNRQNRSDIAEESSEESFNFRVIYARHDESTLKAQKVHLFILSKGLHIRVYP